MEEATIYGEIGPNGSTELGGVTADFEGTGGSVCVFVDPLDGTKEFINRNGQFTVNIALCDRGKPIVGVVFAPAADPPALYYAVQGRGPPVKETFDRQGAYVGSTPVGCRQYTEGDRGLVVVAPPDAD